MQSIQRRWYLEQLFQLSGTEVMKRAWKQQALSQSHWSQWGVSLMLIAFGPDSQFSYSDMTFINLMHFMQLSGKKNGGSI